MNSSTTERARPGSSASALNPGDRCLARRIDCEDPVEAIYLGPAPDFVFATSADGVARIPRAWVQFDDGSKDRVAFAQLSGL